MTDSINNPNAEVTPAAEEEIAQASAAESNLASAAETTQTSAQEVPQTAEEETTQASAAETTQTNDEDATETSDDANPGPTAGPQFVSARAVQAGIDPLALRQALEKMRPKFVILTQAQLQAIRLDAPTMGMGILNRLDDVEPYRDKIAQLPFVNYDYIDNLEDGTLALLEIDSQCKVAVKLPPEVMDTYRDASLFRDQLREEAQILLRRKLLPRGSLDSIAGDRGYRNTAVELTALGNVLRDNWSNVVGKSAITAEEVNRCSVFAQLLYRNADDRLERAAIPAHLSLLRQQAYTWVILAYEELRRCLSFLVAPEMVEKLAPSLFHGRGGRKTDAGAAEESTTEEPAAPLSPDAALEAQIANELTQPAAKPATPSSDPVERAQAAVQATSATAKPSKNPFTT